MPPRLKHPGTFEGAKVGSGGGRSGRRVWDFLLAYSVFYCKSYCKDEIVEDMNPRRLAQMRRLFQQMCLKTPCIKKVRRTLSHNLRLRGRCCVQMAITLDLCIRTETVLMSLVLLRFDLLRSSPLAWRKSNHVHCRSTLSQLRVIG